MSTKHVRTAADLVRFRCALKVECLSCGHAMTMEGYEVAREVGNVPLSQIAARLRCSRCNGKSSRMTVLSPPPPRN
jgi:hypothetical protein